MQKILLTKQNKIGVNENNIKENKMRVRVIELICLEMIVENSLFQALQTIKITNI